MKLLPSMLRALASALFLLPPDAFAGKFQAAGTLLGEGGFGKNETIGLLVLAVVAVVVVIYLKQRKSK